MQTLTAIFSNLLIKSTKDKEYLIRQKNTLNLELEKDFIERNAGYRELYKLKRSYEDMCGFGEYLQAVLDYKKYAKLFEFWCFFKLLELLKGGEKNWGNKINLIENKFTADYDAPVLPCSLYGVVKNGENYFSVCYNVPVSDEILPEVYDEYRAIFHEIHSNKKDKNAALLSPDYLILKSSCGKKWEPLAIIDANFINHTNYEEPYEESKQKIRLTYQKNMRRWPLGIGLFINGETDEFCEESLKGKKANFVSMPVNIINGENFISKEEFISYLI